MVKYMLTAAAVLAFAAGVMASDPPADTKPSATEMERKAKAALAIAATARPDVTARVAAAVPEVAPMPREKVPCVCGNGCQCPTGNCPNKCPVQKTETAKVEPAPTPTPTPQVTYHLQAFRAANGSIFYQWVPDCPNGKCPLVPQPMPRP